MIGTFSLQELSHKLPGKLSGGNAVFTSLSTDTRRLVNGELYLALQGENFNGDDFVADAAEKGACGAIVSNYSAGLAPIPLLEVEDTQAALGSIAQLNRRQSKAQIVALTGSQGKTSVKEMLAAIFACAGKTTATQANLNNTIGVPLTLLGINAEHDFAVIEMGANAPGEIQYSVNLTEPTIALITNATDAHLEGFGSAGGIVKAKGEIIEGLGSDGVLVLNYDDQSHAIWEQRASLRGVGKVVSFSLDNTSGSADAWVSDCTAEEHAFAEFTLHFKASVGSRDGSKAKQESVRVKLNLLGQHNIANALAAALVARSAGVSLEQIKQGLGKVKQVPGRMETKVGRNQSVLIDDSYNASPTSFRAAIDVLKNVRGRTILLVGDMKELGESSEQAQVDVGTYAAAQKIQELWSLGPLSKLTSQSFASSITATGSNSEPTSRHFDTHEAMIAAAIVESGPNVTFLVKGSRGARMDKVVTGLLDNLPPNAGTASVHTDNVGETAC